MREHEALATQTKRQLGEQITADNLTWDDLTRENVGFPGEDALWFYKNRSRGFRLRPKFPHEFEAWCDERLKGVDASVLVVRAWVSSDYFRGLKLVRIPVDVSECEYAHLSDDGRELLTQKLYRSVLKAMPREDLSIGKAPIAPEWCLRYTESERRLAKRAAARPWVRRGR